MPILILQILMIASLVSSGSVQPNATFFVLVQAVLSLSLLVDALVNVLPQTVSLPNMFRRRTFPAKLNGTLSSLQGVAGLGILLGYMSSVSLMLGGVLAVLTMLGMLIAQRKYAPATPITSGIMMLMLSGSLLFRTLTS
jgi:hypothetical protein